MKSPSFSFFLFGGFAGGPAGTFSFFFAGCACYHVLRGGKHPLTLPNKGGCGTLLVYNFRGLIKANFKVALTILLISIYMFI
jgi:hypothetical protein